MTVNRTGDILENYNKRFIVFTMGTMQRRHRICSRTTFKIFSNMTPVPIEASKEDGVEVSWKAELLGRHQSLAQLVRKLFLNPNITLQSHHSTRISKGEVNGDAENLLCNNEKEGRRGATLCHNQVPGLPRDDQPDAQTMLT